VGFFCQEKQIIFATCHRPGPPMLERHKQLHLERASLRPGALPAERLNLTRQTRLLSAGHHSPVAVSEAARSNLSFEDPIQPVL
jgi:hypothetical protein